MRYAQTNLHYICGFIFYDAQHTQHVCTHRRCRRSMGSTTPASAHTDAFQVWRSTMSTIEDPTTFSISMCISSSTMYFQVHGTGILVAVL